MLAWPKQSKRQSREQVSGEGMTSACRPSKELCLGSLGYWFVFVRDLKAFMEDS